MLDDHHDGHGLNETIEIHQDAPDPNAGGASHSYRVFVRTAGDSAPDRTIPVVAHVQFQHGPRHETGSTHGITEGVLLAILIDRLRAFQAGPFSCRENAIALTHLEEALMWVKQRAHNRAKRGVLGTNVK